LFQNALYAGIRQPIEDVQPLPAISHDASISKHGQLLRDIGLRTVEDSLQVTDARLPSLQFVKNPQPGLVREQAEQLRSLLVSFVHSRCIRTNIA
jgi:hypothetical protein